MATTYRKNDQGIYTKPPYKSFWLYLLIVGAFALFVSLLASLTASLSVRVVSWGFGLPLVV